MIFPLGSRLSAFDSRTCKLHKLVDIPLRRSQEGLRVMWLNFRSQTFVISLVQFSESWRETNLAVICSNIKCCRYEREVNSWTVLRIRRDIHNAKPSLLFLKAIWMDAYIAHYMGQQIENHIGQRQQMTAAAVSKTAVKTTSILAYPPSHSYKWYQ